MNLYRHIAREYQRQIEFRIAGRPYIVSLYEHQEFF